VLAEAGYEVREAVNVQDAAEKYAELRPDLMTLDVSIPGGLEFLRGTCACDERARVVVVSALGSQDDVASSSLAGACAYVRKPFEPATIVDVVRKTLLVQPRSSC
jgi:two-component system chemotaxis response regulator CheY